MECMGCGNQNEVIHVDSLELCKNCREQIEKEGTASAILKWIKLNELSILRIKILQKELSKTEQELFFTSQSIDPDTYKNGVQSRIELLKQHESVRLHFLLNEKKEKSL